MPEINAILVNVSNCATDENQMMPLSCYLGCQDVQFRVHYFLPVSFSGQLFSQAPKVSSVGSQLVQMSGKAHGGSRAALEIQTWQLWAFGPLEDL